MCSEISISVNVMITIYHDNQYDDNIAHHYITDVYVT